MTPPKYVGFLNPDGSHEGDWVSVEDGVARQAIDVLYGMRNFARHEDFCIFVRTFTGVESENLPCSCRFDEVLEAFDKVVDRFLSKEGKP